MNMNFDVNQVFQNRLAASLGLDKYQYIMDRVKKTDVSKDSDFQKSFNGFYLMILLAGLVIGYMVAVTTL